MLLDYFSLLCLTASALALPKANNHAVHEERGGNSVWVPREDVRPDGSISLPVRIGLTQKNLHLGHDMLMKVSDPTSEAYGQHMSLEEVYSPRSEKLLCKADISRRLENYSLPPRELLTLFMNGLFHLVSTSRGSACLTAKAG